MVTLDYVSSLTLGSKSFIGNWLSSSHLAALYLFRPSLHSIPLFKIALTPYHHLENLSTIPVTKGLAMAQSEFILSSERSLSEVDGIARLWEHHDTGAQILSITNNDENKCFGVTFRTPPKNSTGVAHILEHSVLCGSKKYRVKEPFVSLLKGSLQTFLNAFTFPDKTCYPVASANLQDFYNLIDVYLDAVFHPSLTENTFQQEGCHLEASSPNGPWTYKGVVYNEMKGVYSSPDSLLAETSQHSLFPDTLYSLDSGGNPELIPSLTYQAFKCFHNTYYHPSNSRFFFWGDDPESRRLDIIAEALKGYKRQEINSNITYQKPFATPRRQQIPYAAQEGSCPKSLFTMNWLLGDRCNVEECLVLEMLEHILEGLPGSPLRRALISSGLGEDTVGAGLETDLRQMFYSTGLKGIDEKDIPHAEDIILTTLRDLTHQGIPPLSIEAAVNAVEFSYRENNFGDFPQGLAAMLQTLSVWLYGGDPLTALAWTSPLGNIKRRLATGEKLFENTINRCFLENASRSVVVLVPDTKLAASKEESERKRAEAARLAATPEQRAELCKQTLALQAAQTAPDTPEDLAGIPNLCVKDLPPKNRLTPRSITTTGEKLFVVHAFPTRGITYADVLLPMPALAGPLLDRLVLFCRSLRETGTSKHDFSSLGSLIAAKTGGIGISPLVVTNLDGTSRLFLDLSGKAVTSKLPDFCHLVIEMLMKPAECTTLFTDRLREMIFEAKARLEQGLIDSGHTAVSRRIQAHFTQDAAIAEKTCGIEYLTRIQYISKNFVRDTDQLIADIQSLRGLLINASSAYVNCIASQNDVSTGVVELKKLLMALPATTLTSGQQTTALLPTNENAEIFVTPSQVNYVGKGTNLYQLGYRYTGAAHVILRYLRMGYLWETVRVKGGAYGASCSLNRSTGNFICTSYRDPNIIETLNAYDGIADYLSHCDLDSAELERAIVGAIGDLDAYQLPDARGRRSFLEFLTSDTEEIRQKIREEIFSTTVKNFREFADIMAEARTNGFISVIGGEKARTLACKNGWHCEELLREH